MTHTAASPGDSPHPGLDELIATVALLRAPGGCPWDADQTHESLVQYLVEESWELIDAIESGDRAEMIEELGDVLYQVLFHADIAAHTDGERFDIDDVARHMTAKMVSRHPHVFGDREAETAEDVVAFWEDLKAEEKPHRTSVLDGVPRGMPALALAQKVLGKAEKAGVGADAAGDVTAPATEAELGDLLFALAASAKAQGLDAERALRGAVRAFEDEVRSAEVAAGS
ncbi:XTP/dITP diphosphohydrolase [Agromyces sp. CF514]|uniref:nucleoside triphosphate pyrophosphohydrolase n=1 Tax=Agromyces sp. CF514 TaxID=1881031 RepID=UPI0008ECDF66|nr:MazG family protein [Agromyces sp. CF514]SFR73755.1 XTP/dITP diphosphohydrolase [Agromyces sp. CF514]